MIAMIIYVYMADVNTDFCIVAAKHIQDNVKSQDSILPRNSLNVVYDVLVLVYQCLGIDQLS